MYKLESYTQKEGVLVVNEQAMYRAYLLAGSLAEAVSIVVGLNRADMLQELAQLRFSFETAGLDVGGIQVKTDRESQAQIGNAFVSLTNDLVPDVAFKAVAGWARLDKAQIKPIAKAVAAHSRGCFAGEKVVDDLINAAVTIEDIEAIDIQASFSAAYRSAYDEVMQPAGA